jgi:sporulation protein YlmC with PRC-barrel domain
MKYLNRYALTLTSAALMCGSVAAQNRSPQQPLTQNRELKAGEFQASHLIGAPVKNPAGDTIGTIDDLIVASGDVNLAVISVGGLLGVGDKKIALPYNQLTVSPDGDTLFVKLTEEELKAKPAFDPDAEADDKAAANRSSASTAASERAAPAARAPAPAPSGAATTRRDSETPAQAAAPERAPSAQQRVAAERSEARSGARTDARTATNEARTLKASEQPASSLIGASVVDSQNSKIAKIHDLLVSAGRQGVQAILAVGGGIAGAGAHLVAVPLDELTIKREADEDRRKEPDRVQTLLTVSQLESMPEFRYE